MNFKATSTFNPRDTSRAMQAIVPRIVNAIEESQAAVVDEAQMICPVGETGELVGSIHPGPISLIGTVVSGTVVADSGHAGFVEFGTGLRGVGTYPYPLPETGVPFTGSWVYDYKKQNWIGHEAQPFMRPGLDTARPRIIAAFARQGFKV
jgi:hypothetical protein